jgi:transcriptional regulator with XRE-family HTH domain
MSLSKTVAQNLLAVRTFRKLSQAEVAKAANVSVSYVSMLERAQRSPPLQTIEAVAKALRVSALDLFQDSRARPRSRAR